MTQEQINKIIQESCDICGCSFDEFFSDRRAESMYMARSLVAKYLSVEEKLTTTQIGELTKQKRDIVARQIRCYNERIDIRKDMLDMLNELKNRIKSWTMDGKQ